MAILRTYICDECNIRFDSFDEMTYVICPNGECTSHAKKTRPKKAITAPHVHTKRRSKRKEIQEQFSRMSKYDVIDFAQEVVSRECGMTDLNTNSREGDIAAIPAYEPGMTEAFFGASDQNPTASFMHDVSNIPLESLRQQMVADGVGNSALDAAQEGAKQRFDAITNHARNNISPRDSAYVNDIHDMKAKRDAHTKR